MNRLPWEAYAVSKNNNAGFWKEIFKPSAVFEMCKPSTLLDHGISVTEIQLFLGFPFEMLFTGFLSLHPVCCARSTKGLSAPAYLPSPQFPENSVDIFIWKRVIWMACQANRGGCTLVIFTGWSIVFLLVGIYKALPQIRSLKNRTPLPIPQIGHFFLLCSQRILWLGISLCTLVPWSRSQFQHVLWQTFTIKNLPLFPHKSFQDPLQGDSLWPLGALVGTCTPFDPVPALIGL